MIYALACAAPAPVDSAPASPEARAQGARIYTTGTGSSGVTITAQLATGSAPASALPCASCHGPEGKGLAEGGVTAPDIRATVLRQPRTVGTRTRSPYTPTLLRRAFTTGLDSDGQALDPVMPRYTMAAADADDLVAWLRVLGEARESDGAVHVGVWCTDDAVAAWLVAEARRTAPIYGHPLDVTRLAPGQPTDRLLAVLAPTDPPALPPGLAVLGPSAPTGAVFTIPATPPGPFAPPCTPLATAPTGADPAMTARGAASLALLVDALARAGGDVSRASLVTALEHTSALDTGCVGRLDYGPDRHTPSPGALP
jgi:hypothetical protein